MKVKDLLPIAPKYSDGSGYNVTIRYKNGRVGFYTMSIIHINNPYPFSSFEEVLNEEVEEICSGYMTDSRLQIFLATDRFLQPAMPKLSKSEFKKHIKRES